MSALPAEVAANTAFLESLGIWHLISTNAPAYSCADAATKRDRLGNIGIPLFDELKSHIGRYEKAGTPHYLVAHCRGHQMRDDNKLASLIGAPVERIGAEELASLFGLQYGLINPFYFARQTNIWQVFDQSVLECYFSPHTMMTNCGHLEYAVEFNPRQLLAVLPNVAVADIANDVSRRPAVERTLGILTGNGPESGIALWQRINERIRREQHLPFRGDTGFPHIIVESVPDMGLSMELEVREPEVRKTVLEAVDRLCRRGATVVGIACNTTQYFSPEVRHVCAEYDATFVSIVDETAAALEREGIREFDLLGIGAVSHLDGWSDFRRIADRFRIAVPSETDLQRIKKLAFEVKKRNVSGKAAFELGTLIRQSTITDTVLLALTELSIVVEKEPRLQTRSGKRFIDTLSLLANRMAEIYLNERLALERLTRPAPDWDTEERVSSNASAGTAGVRVHP